MGFLGISAGKKSTCNARDPGLIPGSGRSTGEGIGYPCQYSCLENPQGQRSLAGYSPWVHEESDTTEWRSTRDIVWQLPFSVWLASPNMIISRSIHSAVNGSVSFFYYGWYSIVYIYTMSSLSSPLSMTLGCFRFLLRSTVLLWMFGGACPFSNQSFFRNICLGMGWLDPMVTLFLAFKDTSILFFIVVRIYILTNSVGGLTFFLLIHRKL